MDSRDEAGTSREKLYTSFIRTVSAEPMAESQRNPREVQYGATPLFFGGPVSSTGFVA